jgi:uncharacterized protein (TIGR03437 family)
VVFLTPALFAQFSGLASTTDGSLVYFASTLRLKSSLSQPLNGKIYAATQDGVSLYRARESSALPPNAPPCSVGGFADYLAAEASSADVVALLYRAQSAAGCSYPPNPYITQFVTASGETNVPGIARLSTNGRYAVVFLGSTARINAAVSISLLDIRNGTKTPVSLPALAFPQYFLQPASGGRVIANDGTAVVAITDGGTQAIGYLAKPGMDPTPFPVSDGLPLIIDASGSKVLYRKQGLNLIDLHTLTSTPLVPADVFASGPGMSDDARRLLYLSDGQAHVLDTTTLIDRTLTNDPAKITQATISGDGKTIFVVTGIGRLLKINADDGSETEFIGHTPYLVSSSAVIAGLTTTLTGRGLSDAVINGTVPLNPWLGNVTMWIDERKVPMTQLTPISVSFIVPWDLQANGGTIRMLAEAPGDHTPFYFPEVEVRFAPEPAPRAGPVLRQDWSQTYVGPINTGEIIHVYAIGFGPVSPAVPDGAAAPAAEPFSRITQTFTCSNAEILYAGLAPGAVERVYQIDIRIGPTPGYQKFLCNLGGQDFTFLTLNIVP